MSKTLLFQAILFSIKTVFCLQTVKCKNSSISNNSVENKYAVYMSNDSISNDSVQHKYRLVLFDPYSTRSGATTQSQSGPGSNGNKGALCIPQSSSITGASPSDCLVSYPRHSLGERVVPFCRYAVDLFYSSS